MSDLLTLVAKVLAEPERDHLHLEFTGLPDNPNKKMKQHWTKNAAHNKEWRQAAWLQGYTCKGKISGAMALLHYHVSLGDNRRHDYDNVLASFKPVQDGLVDAGMLTDDTFEWVIPIITFDRTKPRRFSIDIYSLD